MLFMTKATKQMQARWNRKRICAILLCAAGFSAAAPAMANDCRLADPNSLGEHVGEICWFQFGTVGTDIPAGTSNAPYEFDLPDGSKVRLQLSVTGGTNANPRLTVAQAPTWTGSNFSGTSGYYRVLTPNAAALHSPDGRGNESVLTLSDIRLYAPNGVEVTDLPFEIITADAERLNIPEYLDFGVVSGGTPWTLVEWLGTAPASAVLQGTPTTLDPAVPSACQSGYVDCLRFKGATSSSDGRAAVLATRKAVGSAQPFTVMGQIHSDDGQGFAVGVRWGSLRLRKALPEGRLDAADQFAYRILNVNGEVVSSGVTSGSGSGTSAYVGTMAMPGNSLTLVEEMAPGSASGLTQYARRIACTEIGSGQTVLDQAYDPAAPPQVDVPDLGDGIDCTFTNTPVRVADLRIEKSADVSTVTAGDPVTYTLAITNDGPGAADGAVVTDPAVAGLDCTAATLSCSAADGATCPVGATVAQLQAGTGVPIPVLPAGGSIALSLTCTVTANGLP